MRPIFFAYMSLFVLGLVDCIRGPLFPEIISYFGINQTQGSLFFAVCSTAGFFGGVLGGKWVHRMHTLKTLRLGTLIQFLALVGMGMSSHYWVLVASSFLLGISFGVLGVAENVITNIFSSESFRSRIQSGLHTMYAVSSFLAPGFVTLIAYYQGNWKTSFLVASAVVFVFFVSTFFIFWEDPKEEITDHSQPLSLKANLFCWILATYVAVELLVSTRLPYFLREIHQMDLKQSSLYTSYFFLCLLGGRLIFVLIRPQILMWLQLVASMFLSTAFVLLGVYVHPLAMVLSGFFMAPFYPLAMALAGDLFQKNLAKVIGHAIAVSAFMIVVMHLSVGLLSDLYGIVTAFLVSAVFGLSCCFMLWCFRKL
jgi:FHS family glucose/mannose:H+ symporter-like MFS transporter